MCCDLKHSTAVHNTSIRSSYEGSIAPAVFPFRHPTIRVLSIGSRVLLHCILSASFIRLAARDFQVLTMCRPKIEKPIGTRTTGYILYWPPLYLPLIRVNTTCIFPLYFYSDFKPYLLPQKPCSLPVHGRKTGVEKAVHRTQLSCQTLPAIFTSAHGRRPSFLFYG